MEPISIEEQRERFNQRQRDLYMERLRARAGHKQPVWLRRMAENKAKDMTGYIRPEGPDAA